MRLFVDNLTNVDFSYLCPDRGLVGETWLASIELVGELDEQGMVCDFGIVKKRVRQWLDQTLDHCLLVPTRNANIQTTTPDGRISVSMKYGESRLLCDSPAEAITRVDADIINTDTVAEWSAGQMRSLFDVQTLRLRFQPEVIDGPWYHYSHGLKKHGGNCQRIAHGHRSRIMVWRNGKLCLPTMQRWADQWRDIYIGSVDDIVEEKEGTTVFRYLAQQGQFLLELPSTRCYIVDTDTTVEWIAHHIASTLKRETPDDVIEVRAYEGIGKGAVVAL